MTILLQELYTIAGNAEVMLLPLVTAPPEVWVPQLKPRDDDYAAVFVGGAAARAREGYAALWSGPPATLGKPSHTRIKAFATEADAFLTAASSRASFRAAIAASQRTCNQTRSG